ncbi:MAG: phosphoglucosamine mutase [Deltaproteobacteria bacterium]|nr:phosphoglucosamine mutase [Deltaproteobacteria bacterium]MBW2075688.1 phosphoglucosamine mutase [Deltaproteobacteria bacterium]RLB80098.1 MAG: phosphoglucosamine mutase [Deltaproteobacteria bacterium]
MKRLFGTDGIRGLANEYPMTSEMALKIGRATAHLFRRQGHKTRIIIGRDTRISGHMLEHALVSGICSMGADVLLAGVLPTPGVAFITRDMHLDAGIMISASHNPSPDNGIKIFKGDGFKLSDEMELEMEQLILENNMPTASNGPHAFGRAYPFEDACARYVTLLKQVVSKDQTMEGLNIVLDCANGATFQVAPATFTELGATIKTLFAEPDGTNINLKCGSEHPEALCGEVVKRKADAGFAFDGDGDRVTAVDERGNIVTGDQMLAICAKVMKEQNQLTNNVVVSTVMSNTGLGLTLKELGIEHVTTQVGDRYVLQEMLARGACIGGEDSGHMIFLDHHSTGDGIITAIRIVIAMKRAGKPLSELAKAMRVFPQRLINVAVRDKPPIESVPEIVAAVEGVKRVLGDGGRVLVRYSGTQPMCRVMVEGPVPEETERYCKQIADVVREKLS